MGFMTKIKNIIVITLAMTLLSACGPNADFISPYERLVPAENNISSGNESTSVDVESPANEVAKPAQNNLIPLREKVLASTDINVDALDNAFIYYEKNQKKIKNKNFVTVFDIGKHNGKKRMYVINMNTGDVVSMLAAHGSGSDPDVDGYATKFSNVSGSKQSSLGFMLTGERYYGKNGLSLKLDGQESRNNNVRPRAVVIHGADYVSPGLSRIGNSWGCPAVSHSNVKWMIPKLEGGSLLYIFNDKYD